MPRASVSGGPSVEATVSCTVAGWNGALVGRDPSTTRASWSASTASTSAAWPARAGGSSSTPRSTSRRAMSGPSWRRPRATRVRPGHRPSPVGWRLTWTPAAGGSSGSCPTTAASSARLSSATASARWALSRRSSGPVGRPPMGRRARPADNPRGVLAAVARAQPGAQADRPDSRPCRIPPLLQRGAHPHRPADPGSDALAGTHRSPEDAPTMTEMCRYISEAVQSRRSSRGSGRHHCRSDSRECCVHRILHRTIGAS